MKKISKILCLILSVICVFVSAIGCKSKSKKPTGTTLIENGAYEGGLHSYDVSVMNGEYILRDGTVNYKLVLPNESATRSLLAGADFQMLFLEATGKAIEGVRERDVTYDANSRYIVLGCHTLEQSAGLELDERVNANGFEIVTKGKSIFVMGQDATGVLFGTYELLTQILNYERYTTRYYVVDKNVTEIPMYNFKVIDNPDFERRIGPWGAVYTNNTNASRMRFVLQRGDVYAVSPETNFVHNTLMYLDPQVYFDEHKEWYAQQPTSKPIAPHQSDEGPRNVFQLCYTAHGNAEQYTAMVDTMAQRLCEVLAYDTEHNIITMTAEDNKNYCSCSACVAEKEHYGGTISGSMFKLLNKVAKKVQAWIDENQPGRDVLVAMFAYHDYQAPPVKEVNGTFVPIDDDVKGEPNSAVFIAPSDASYLDSFNAEINATEKRNFAGWDACCDNFGVWLYQTLYDNYFMPYDNFGSMQDNYRVFVEMGARWIFDQGQQGNENLTGFNNFKLYLNSKLQWNVNYDYNELLDNYFSDMFGPAKDVMLQYFYSLRLHLYDVIGGNMNDIESSLDSAEYFPYATVNQWLNYCDQAYKAIESLKQTDVTLWQYYYDHICTESIMARWMLISYYPGSMDSTVLKQQKSSFKEDVYRLGFTEWSQHNDIGEKVDEW